MQLLPIFPLKMVVFPGEKLNLHVFESRYKQLINQCYEEGKPFGIPFYNNNRLMPIMAEIELVEISKIYDDGKLDVKTKARHQVVRITELQKTLPDKLYAAAAVEPLEYDFEDSEFLLAVKIQEQMVILYELLNIDKEIPTAENLRIFNHGHLFGLSQMQEFQLVTLKTESERQIFIYEHLISFIPTIVEMQELQRKAKLNGYFKDILPPNFKVSDFLK
jgi:ATP-dependent Lon protease